MSKHKTRNRFVSMALAILMLVTGIMPTSAFAQEMPTSEKIPALTESVESSPVESEEVITSSSEEVLPSEETIATEEAVEDLAPEVEVTTEETTTPEEELVSEPATETTSKAEETTAADTSSTTTEETTPVEEQSTALKQLKSWLNLWRLQNQLMKMRRLETNLEQLHLKMVSRE